MLQRRGRIYDCIRSQSSPRFGVLVDRREESIYAMLDITGSLTIPRSKTLENRFVPLRMTINERDNPSNK